MRERFVYGAQTMSMPGPDTLEAAPGPAKNTREELISPDRSEEAVACLNTAPIPSPLTAFLTRNELVPFILELEKSLLVSKEHDYAKAPDRTAIFQATTILERKAETTDARGRTETTCGSRAPPYDELLNCCGMLAKLRCSLLRDDDEVTSRHLREVVSLQAALVREQQEQLYCKDRELASIRKDRDQLEARLERMERRLAVHQKRNTLTTPDTDSRPSPSTPRSLGTSRRHSRTESLILSERSRPRSRSSSVEQSRSRLRPSGHTGTPTPQEEGGGKKSARKRLRTEENNISNDSPNVKRIRKPLKLAEIRTKLEYRGLGLLSMQDGVVPTVTTNHTIEDTVNEALCSLPLSNSISCNTETIIVPSWRLHPLEIVDESSCCANPEDITDDVFLRRHKKHEEDEKRRKRWDLQRARALLEHQQLLDKYNKKGSGALMESTVEKKDKIVTFSSKPEDIEEIEILPTVAVSAFGFPLPQLKRSEFELPWFDLDVREARENVRTTRSKARAASRTTSAGSSTDDA